jgi:hypothetical protein
MKAKRPLSLSCVLWALLCLLIGVWIGFHFNITTSSEEQSHNYLLTNTPVLTRTPVNGELNPQTRSTKNRRLLFMAAVYGMKQFLYLQRTLDYVRDICNAGWDVHVILSAANELDYDHPRFKEIQDRAFCHAAGSFIPIELKKYGNIGFGLNKENRQSMLEHLNDFDYFVYVEEDMAFTINHLNAFIQSEEKLKQAFPRTWVRYVTGFLR